MRAGAWGNAGALDVITPHMLAHLLYVLYYIVSLYSYSTYKLKLSLRHKLHGNVCVCDLFVAPPFAPFGSI
jgi:hypothetical protein